MDKFLAALANGFSQPLADLVVAAFAALAAAGTKALMAHTKNVRVQGMLDRLDQASVAAVRQVAQVGADAIKGAAADGSLTPSEAKAAAALAIVKANLGEKGLAELKKVIQPDDVLALITSHNESALVEHKLAVASAVTAPPTVAAAG